MGKLLAKAEIEDVTFPFGLPCRGGLDPDKDDAAMEAALDEQADAEWQLIRTQNFSDIRHRARAGQRMFDDLAEAGLLVDARYQAAIAVLLKILGLPKT